MAVYREKAPAFQFYAKEFMTDANQAGMSLHEAGAYIRLMCIEWNEHGKGIADNAVKCARMVGATDTQMKKMWPTLRRCFVEHRSEAGMLTHPRLEKEREKQENYRRRQSDKGLASAALRLAKQPTGGQPEGNHGSTAVQPNHQPNVNSPISDLRSPISNLPSKRSRTNTVTYGDDFLRFWEHYPKRVGKDDAWRAWTRRRPDIETVLHALEAQHAFMLRDGGAFIPNPATWLNQGRWQDEPPTTQAITNKRIAGLIKGGEAFLKMGTHD